MTTPTTPVAPIDKRGERIKAMFASIAPRYDLLNRLLSLRIDQRWRRKVVDLVPPDDTGKPILDVCTGTGDLAIMYARRLPNLKVVGADFCAPMLEQAKIKSKKLGVRVDWREADALSLPFDDDAFQVTMVAFGLRNVADTDAGLRELARVTATGGRVAILEFSTPTVQPLRASYLFYFQRVLPWIGQRLAPNRDAAYHYLPASVLEFPEREALTSRMEAAGLCDVAVHPLTFGVATLYIGRKKVTAPTLPAAAEDNGRNKA
jgi:demethylmenaquinone methyltransferase / 2-methoxy-6-polyprenyl-1,4-benzoquinol methylase